MRRFASPATGTEQTERRIQAVQAATQPVAAIASLVVLVLALADSAITPRWPETVSIVLLGLGLAAGPLLHRVNARVRHPPAQSAAAVAVLVVLIFELQRSYPPPYSAPTWPESIVIVLLGLGLAAGPAARLVSRREIERSAERVVVLAALCVAVYTLSDPNVYPRWPATVTAVLLGLGLVADSLARRLRPRLPGTSVLSLAAAPGLVLLIVTTAGLSQYTSRGPELVLAVLLGVCLTVGMLVELRAGASPQRSVATVAAVAALVGIAYELSTVDVYPHWPQTVTAVVLGAGLVADQLVVSIRGRAVPSLALTGAAVVGLAVLLYGLSTLGAYTPAWPELVTAAMLGLGLLAAGSLGRLRGAPREQVLSARVDELSRTRRGALDVQATELRRIERDLHDGAQARLVALSMKLGRAEDRYHDDPETAALLREAREDAAQAIRELRELARGIAPPVLADRGLEAAARSLAQRSGARVTVTGQLHRRLLPAVETAAYFVVAESLTNAAKHAAGSRVEIRLDERGGDLFVEITDFGPGGADDLGGGLSGLRQRVEALDGALHVTSPAGVGTQVEAVLPCGR